MILQFDWCGCTAISDDEKYEVEDSIRKTFEDRGELELKPCHIGQVKVQLNIDGPLNFTLVGNIACSCGKRYCIFKGSKDASRVTFERVD